MLGLEASAVVGGNMRPTIQKPSVDVASMFGIMAGGEYVVESSGQIIIGALLLPSSRNPLELMQLCETQTQVPDQRRLHF